MTTQILAPQNIKLGKSNKITETLLAEEAVKVFKKGHPWKVGNLGWRFLPNTRGPGASGKGRGFACTSNSEYRHMNQKITCTLGAQAQGSTW